MSVQKIYGQRFASKVRVEPIVDILDRRVYGGGVMC